MKERVTEREKGVGDRGGGGGQSDRQRHRDMQRDGDGRRGERLLGPNNARTENSV